MRTLIVCALLVVLVSVAFAADVSGKWTAQVPGRGGNTSETTFVFKADGAKLSGTMDGGRGGPAEISDGKVDGDSISFNVVRSFGGNEVKMVFQGKVAGDSIEFTRSMQGGMGGEPIKFTAKKAN